MKKILILLVLLVLGLWTASADLLDWFFCQVRKNDIIIALKKIDSFYKCKDIIASLETVIIQTAKDLMTIQTYLNRRRDVDYWLSIKKDKLATIDTLQIVRKSISENMKTFETNLTKKSIQWFILTITPYKIRLQKSLVTIAALQQSGFATMEINNYALVLKAQVATLDNISKVTTMKDLTPLLTKYVYFKKLIEWKYE